MIIINGKTYRNVQEQVKKNMDDIAELQQGGGGGTVDAYTKAESDAKFATKTEVENDISALYGDFYTKTEADDRFPTETHMEYLLGNYVVKSINNEDASCGINYGLFNNTPQLIGSDSEGSHPCDARVQVTYDQVHINANDYNHGDNDDTYTGSIDVTDGYVDIAATNGTNTTTLRVAPSGVTVNGNSLVDYHAGTNVNFTPHSGTSGYDINVPMKTINGNPINGIGNITLATLTEKFFRVNITVGNPVTKTWYYTFRAEASLDTTKTGIDAVFSYVPEGAIVFSPDDNCLYTIVSLVPNSQSTIAKYDGTTATYLTAAFVNTTVQAI